MSDTAEFESPQDTGGTGVAAGSVGARAAAGPAPVGGPDAVAAAQAEALHESVHDEASFVGVEEFPERGASGADVEAALDGAQEALDAAVPAVDEASGAAAIAPDVLGGGEGGEFTAAAELDEPDADGHSDLAAEADESADGAAEDPGERDAGAAIGAGGLAAAAAGQPGQVAPPRSRRSVSLGTVLRRGVRVSAMPGRLALSAVALPMVVLPQKLRKVVGVAAVVTLLNALLTWGAVLMIPPSARVPKPDPVDSSHGKQSAHGGGVQREGKVEASGAKHGSHSGGGQGGGHAKGDGHAKGGGHDSKKSGGHDKKSDGHAKKSGGHAKKGGGGGGGHH